ncbi:unnamed protein product [Staurois parvus]|uniref:Uncharacterized protein n=1 Tax=Staurois parvus TaxID=386267 RepID=A0ABN9G3P8_9NEOB|nr:unnamed protein product [Staurois parvus]
MISVAPSVPPVSVHQCQLSVHINATYQCLPVHINATYQCPSELPFSANYHCQSVSPECCQSVPPISAMPISATNQCPSAQPISAHHRSLISAHL